MKWPARTLPIYAGSGAFDRRSGARKKSSAPVIGSTDWRGDVIPVEKKVQVPKIVTLDLND